MSVFDESMIPMLEVFIYETTTLLDQLDEILLEAEKSKSLTEDNINEIFRTMHTIKGSAAMMGLTGIATLAHRVEDMFFIIRDDPSKLNSSNSSLVFDLLFQASDFFKSEVEAIQRGDDYQPANSDALVARIERDGAIIKNGAAAPKDVPVAPPVQPGTPVEDAKGASMQTDKGDPTHRVRVFFEDDCQMENIRAFMLLSQLKDSCEFLDSDPQNPESNAACAADIVRDGFLVIFKTSSPIEHIYAIIESSMSIKSYEDVTDEEAAAAKAPSAPAPKQVEMSQQPSQVPDAGMMGQPTVSEVPSEPELPTPAAAPTAGLGKNAMGKQSLISVNQTKLDQLMDIMGEIVIAEAMVASNPELKGLHLDDFYKSTRQLRKLTDQLQDVVMSIRMVPLTTVFQKMNRIVRDMNKKLGKEVELETLGGETEVDKTINDVLGDPFMHMIRNAMDHAIESPEVRKSLGKKAEGTITLSAQNVGGEIVITVADDGQGLDRARIVAKAKRNGLLTKNESEYTDKEIFGMIMLPGFSTNEVVTEFSGRGVGMDVVRKNIETVNGSISVESKKNVGTTFTIKIPLTLAIIDGMEISVNRNMYTIPITSIKNTFKLSEDTKLLTDTDGTEMIMLRGDCYPVIRLHQIYNIATEIEKLEDGIFILVSNEHKSACIFVDELLGEQQVVVKPFPPFLNRYDVKDSGLSGCTIRGDGSISLILDVNSFLQKF